MPVRLLGLSVSCDRPLRAGEAGIAADVTVTRAVGPLTQPRSWVGTEDWPRISISGDSVTLWFDDEAVFELDRRLRQIRYHLLAELDEQTFAHELVDAVLPRFVALLGMRVLHGSSVAGPAGAVVLVGRSGAGKSTMATFLTARGRHLLGDDAAVIVDIDGVAHVVPSGTSLRLHEESADAALPNEPVFGPPMAQWSAKRLVSPSDNALVVAEAPTRLLAVVELVESTDERPALVRLDGGESFELLARNSFDLPDDSPTAGIALLDRWTPLASRVPAYRLTRRHDLSELGATSALLDPLLDGHG